MNTSDRILSSLDSSLSRSKRQDGSYDLRGLQASLERAFAGFPRDCAARIVEGFSARLDRDPGSAETWLRSIVSIFAQSYDGFAMPQEDWEWLRDTLSELSGELDLELLSYAMSLVLDQGAL
jgi:hypothetical protein